MHNRRQSKSSQRLKALKAFFGGVNIQLTAYGFWDLKNKNADEKGKGRDGGKKREKKKSLMALILLLLLWPNHNNYNLLVTTLQKKKKRSRRK